MGTARHENNTVSLGFSRADGSARDTTRTAVLYRNTIPISGQADSRDSVLYKEKRTLPRAPADVSQFVCVTALDPERPISVTEFGNINPIPFRHECGHTVNVSFIQLLLHLPSFRTDLACVLGPTDPCSTAVHMEPFSTSVFKVLV